MCNYLLLFQYLNLVFMKKKYLYSLAKISIFNFGRNLIIISINHDIYKENYVYTYDLYRIPIF